MVAVPIVLVTTPLTCPSAPNAASVAAVAIRIVNNDFMVRPPQAAFIQCRGWMSMVILTGSRRRRLDNPRDLHSLSLTASGCAPFAMPRPGERPLALHELGPTSGRWL